MAFPNTIGGWTAASLAAPLVQMPHDASLASRNVAQLNAPAFATPGASSFPGSVSALSSILSSIYGPNYQALLTSASQPPQRSSYENYLASLTNALNSLAKPADDPSGGLTGAVTSAQNRLTAAQQDADKFTGAGGFGLDSQKQAAWSTLSDAKQRLADANKNYQSFLSSGAGAASDISRRKTLAALTNAGTYTTTPAVSGGIGGNGWISQQLMNG